MKNYCEHCGKNLSSDNASVVKWAISVIAGLICGLGDYADTTPYERLLSQRLADIAAISLLGFILPWGLFSLAVLIGRFASG